MIKEYYETWLRNSSESRKSKQQLRRKDEFKTLMISTSDRSIEQIPVLVSIKLIFSTFAQRLRKISLTRLLTPSINIQRRTVEPSDNNNAFSAKILL